MKKKIKQQNQLKNTLVLILVVSVLVSNLTFLLAPLQASAQLPGIGENPVVGKKSFSETCGWWGFFSNFYECGMRVIGAFLDIFLYVAAILVYIAGALLDAVIFAVENLAIIPAVEVAWTFVRDISNLLLILAFLIIGLGTVLQLDAYGYGKKVLPRLILVAILINFSLVLTGFVIDFTNILSKFFLDIIRPAEAGSGIRNVALELAKGLSTQKIFESNGEAAALTAILAMLIGLLGGLIALLITAIVFFATAFFMAFRVVALWQIMILSPGAFLLGAIPATHQYFKKWADYLFKWAFFAPAYFFLLSLTITIIRSDAFSKIVVATNNAASKGDTAQFASNAFVGSIGSILKYVFVISMLIKDLTWAKEFGITGAATVTGWTNKLGGWAQKKTWQATSRGAVAAGAYAAGKVAPGMSRITQALPKPLQKLSGYAERGLGRVQQLRDKDVKESAKTALNQPMRTLASAWNSYSRPTQDRILKDAKPEQFTELVQTLNQSNASALLSRSSGSPMENTIRTARPELYAEQLRSQGLSNEETQQRMNAFMDQRSPEEKRNMGAGAIKDGSIREWLFKNGTAADLRAFANTPEKLEEMVTALRRAGPMGTDPNRVAQNIRETYGNNEMANYIQTNPWMQVNLQWRQGGRSAGITSGRGSGGRVQEIINTIREEGEEAGRATPRPPEPGGGGGTA